MPPSPCRVFEAPLNYPPPYSRKGNVRELIAWCLDFFVFCFSCSLVDEVAVPGVHDLRPEDLFVERQRDVPAALVGVRNGARLPNVGVRP